MQSSSPQHCIDLVTNESPILGISPSASRSCCPTEHPLESTSWGFLSVHLTCIDAQIKG